MTYGNSLGNGEDVHQISGYCEPILEAVVSRAFRLILRCCGLPPLYNRTNCLETYRSPSSSRGECKPWKDLKYTSSKCSNLEIMQLFTCQCQKSCGLRTSQAVSLFRSIVNRDDLVDSRLESGTTPSRVNLSETVLSYCLRLFVFSCASSSLSNKQNL